MSAMWKLPPLEEYAMSEVDKIFKDFDYDKEDIRQIDQFYHDYMRGLVNDKRRHQFIPDDIVRTPPEVTPLTNETKAIVVNALTQHILTEHTTDEMIDLILSKINLPWWVPKGIVRRVLDQMLPGVLLDSLLTLIHKHWN